MAKLADIVFDCRHPASLARFWQAALDDYSIAPYDDQEMARLADQGIVDPEDDPTVLLECAQGGPRIWFQRVNESKVVKNPVHLDVQARNVNEEAARLAALGATLTTPQPDNGLVVMADPEGNEFCVVS